jgi:hypothetical protein
VGAAAWAAARIELGEIDAHRARAIARQIAGDAAASMSLAARTTPGLAPAREAARSALAPMLEALRRSALALLDRMLPTLPHVGAAAADADVLIAAGLATSAR